MKRRIYIAGAALLALVAAFLAGKYFSPTKVEKKTEWREIRSYTTEWAVRTEFRDRTKVHTRIVTIEKVQPDGSSVTTTTEESGADLDVTSGTNLTGHSSETTASNAATVTVSETGRPGWALGVNGVWDPGRLSLEPERVEVDVARRLAGTVWLVVQGSANTNGGDPRVGAGVRMEF